METVQIKKETKGIAKKFKIVLIQIYGFNSFGIRSIYSVLKSKNFDVDIIFFKNAMMDEGKPSDREFELLVNKVVELKPDLIGLSFVSPYFVFAKKIIKMLREETNAKIITGGTHATICPEECIKVSDFVCVGEGEDTIISLINRLIKNKKTINISNMWAKENGVVYRNDIAFMEENLDKFPVSDLESDGKYYIFREKLFNGEPLIKQKELNKYFIVTSRGCPFQCTFCINSFLNNTLYKGKKIVRKHSVDYVIKELNYAKSKIRQMNWVFFIDENFVTEKEWLDEFLLKYKKEINFPFECELHPSLAKEDVIKNLKKAGLKNIFMGIQGSQRMRFDVYKRFDKDEDLIRVANILKKYDIHATYDIITENPYENEEDYKSVAKLFLKIPRPYNLRIYSLINYPKTELTERLRKENLLITKEEKTFDQYRVTLDYRRKKFILYWVCIFAFISNPFIPKHLIRFIIKYKIFRNHPKVLIPISNFANYIKLVQMGVKGLIHGNVRFRGAFKKFVDAVRRGHPV